MNKTMTFQVNSNINITDDYANPATGHYTSNPAHNRKIFANISFEVEIPVGKHYADDDYAQLEADVQNVIKVATDNSRLMLEAIRPRVRLSAYSTEPSENPDAGDAGFISYPDGERDQPF